MVKKRLKQTKVEQRFPKPVILQRTAQAVLNGKCKLSKPTYAKLKKHKAILRKLANMKGNNAKKLAFIKRNKKQVGGFLPMLPLIAKAVTAFLPGLVSGLLNVDK